MRQYSKKVPAGGSVAISPETTPVTVQNVGDASVRVFFDEGEGVGLILLPTDAVKAACELVTVVSPVKMGYITVVEA